MWKLIEVHSLAYGLQVFTLYSIWYDTQLQTNKYIHVVSILYTQLYVTKGFMEISDINPFQIPETIQKI